MLPGTLPVAKKTLGHTSYCRVDFYAVYGGARQYFRQGQRQSCATQAHDQYAFGVGLDQYRTSHHAGVGKHHFVGIAQVNASMPPVIRSEEHTSELQSLMRIS